MREKFNIDGYLNEAEERFSGFYGDYDYDNFDDDYDNFDDYSAADAQSATGGQMDMLKAPSPYQVSVVNSSAGTLTAVLFGTNQYLLTTNFGSATGITVTPAQTNVSYLFLLQQSAYQPFETSLIRIQSTNAAQITQILTVTVLDANGQSATLPIITQSYFSSYQQQSGILDVPYSLKIDGNTNVSFPVLATTTVVLTFFPAGKINAARTLGGQSSTAVYGNPQVNLGGMVFPKRPLGAGRTKRRIG